MEKMSFIFLAILFVSSCQESNSSTTLLNDWKSYFDEHNVEGGIVIYELENDKYQVYNEDWCKTGFLPASTFKIPNSLIALETGVITPEDTMYWDGVERWLPSWSEDHVLKSAFRVSCVPCYQGLAREIGVERMQKYTQLIDYGNLEIRDTTIDNFWLTGNSRITPYEQVDFLTKLVQNELPFKDTVITTVKDIMLNVVGEEYGIYAKTGWSQPEGVNNGWYVGYAETEEQGTIIFALNIQRPQSESSDGFADARQEIVKNILRHLKYILSLDQIGYLTHCKRNKD